ncbi:MAG: hypothetical protein AAFR16_05865 [Pseudomonadota bacterium]
MRAHKTHRLTVTPQLLALIESRFAPVLTTVLELGPFVAGDRVELSIENPPAHMGPTIREIEFVAEAGDLPFLERGCAVLGLCDVGRSRRALEQDLEDNVLALNRALRAGSEAA